MLVSECDDIPVWRPEEPVVPHYLKLHVYHVSPHRYGFQLFIHLVVTTLALADKLIKNLHTAFQ